MKTQLITSLLIAGLAFFSITHESRAQADYSTYMSPETQRIMNLTNGAVRTSLDAAQSVQRTYNPNETYISPGAQRIMSMTQGMIQADYNFMARVKAGDPTVWQDSEEYIRRLNGQAAMLAGQVASGQIQVSVNRQQQANAWLRTSQQSYNDAYYWARQRDYGRANSALLQAEDYRRSAVKLIQGN